MIHQKNILQGSKLVIMVFFYTVKWLTTPGNTLSVYFYPHSGSFLPLATTISAQLFLATLPLHWWGSGSKKLINVPPERWSTEQKCLHTEFQPNKGRPTQGHESRAEVCMLPCPQGQHVGLSLSPRSKMTAQKCCLFLNWLVFWFTRQNTKWPES